MSHCRRAIGRVSPHTTCGIGLVEQASRSRPLIGGGIGRPPFADEAKAAIDRDMVLVAESGMAMSTGGMCRPPASPWCTSPSSAHRDPSGAASRACPSSPRVPSLLDRLLLLFGVALLRRGDQAGIYDLARHGDIAGGRSAASNRANSARSRRPSSAALETARSCGRREPAPKAPGQKPHE